MYMTFFILNTCETQFTHSNNLQSHLHKQPPLCDYHLSMKIPLFEKVTKLDCYHASSVCFIDISWLHYWLRCIKPFLKNAAPSQKAGVLYVPLYNSRFPVSKMAVVERLYCKTTLYDHLHPLCPSLLKFDPSSHGGHWRWTVLWSNKPKRSLVHFSCINHALQ